MSKDVLEIRWYGRGGQGAKTAALLFADAALGTGKYVQAFPEYGPERMGAPVQSFNRIADMPITVHCAVTAPDVVVILDETLIGTVDVVEGLPDDGSVIVNTSMTPQEMRKKLCIEKGHVYTVNASSIAKEFFGMDKPNTPLMGALVKVVKILDINQVLEDTRKKLDAKFKQKPEVIDGNINSIRKAYETIQAE